MFYAISCPTALHRQKEKMMERSWVVAMITSAPITKFKLLLTKWENLVQLPVER